MLIEWNQTKMGYPTLKIERKGVFDVNKMYHMVKGWFDENNYIYTEKENTTNKKDKGVEIKMAMMYPPRIEITSQTIVSTGTMTISDKRRGTASFFMGSIPKAVMASIWLEDFMEPNSAVIPAATRAATIRAVNMGPSSRTIAIARIRPR